MQNQSDLAEVNVNLIRQRIGSKKELYEFLTQECNAYLPKLTCTNIYFLKSIVNGEKNYLRRNEVVVTAIPQIEGLTSDDFINFAQQNQQILQFLPDQCDWHHLDRQWICDVMMTIDPQGTQRMVQQAKENRRDRLNKSQNMIVGMRPEFLQALNNTLSFSTHKGRSAFLLKPSSQRKRRVKELEEVKHEEQQLNQSKQKYLQQNKRVREELTGLQEQLDELNDYKNLVMQLHQSGIINEEGNPLMPPPNHNDSNNNMQ